MNEGQPSRPYKRGLDLPPHVARRIPWLVVGTVIGALCVPVWLGQTKAAALLEIVKRAGGGLAVGLLVDFLTRRWLFPKLSD